jgi:hypothetical protein
MAEHWNGGTGGKGSKPRPFNISQEEYADRVEAIFGKKKKKDDRPEDNDIRTNNSDAPSSKAD